MRKIIAAFLIISLSKFALANTDLYKRFNVGVDFNYLNTLGVSPIFEYRLNKNLAVGATVGGSFGSAIGSYPIFGGFARFYSDFSFFGNDNLINGAINESFIRADAKYGFRDYTVSDVTARVSLLRLSIAVGESFKFINNFNFNPSIGLGYNRFSYSFGEDNSSFISSTLVSGFSFSVGLNLGYSF